ncbi:hypothetical protein HDV00_010655 [Rhizophlyctis rosea]|nr:hypothetical protein HDV00_010655 [Rhizophlyctis rosea]
MVNALIAIGILIASVVVDQTNRQSIVDNCVNNSIDLPDRDEEDDCNTAAGKYLIQTTVFNVIICLILIYASAVLRSFYLDISVDPVKYGIGVAPEVTDTAYPLVTVHNPWGFQNAWNSPNNQPPLPPYQPPPPKYEPAEEAPPAASTPFGSTSTLQDEAGTNGDGVSGPPPANHISLGRVVE